MNTHPIAQKIKAAYLRAVNNEMVGDYQPSFVANLMRRIVELIFRTPDFAIELPIESQWRDYYATALCISAYLGYVQYTLVADDTLAVITLTDPYRSQILAATTADDVAPDVAAPQFVGAQYFAPASTTPPTTPQSTTPPTTPTASTAPSTPSTRAVRPRASRAAANFRLKAVTTASLEGSLCNSRGQGRRGRPQPSESVHYAKSLEDATLPHHPRRNPLLINDIHPHIISPIRLNSPTAPPTALPIAMPPPQPAHPPPHRLSAALI